MKKIINQPETLVEEMCCGMAAAHPELEVLRKYKIIKTKAPIIPSSSTYIAKTKSV